MSLRAGRFVNAAGLVLVSVLSAGATFAQQSSSSSAEQDSELPQIYARGMAEFQAGDYARAADLEALVAKAEFTPQLEPAFFTVGSSHFNAGDYNKAVAAFKNYQTKFPNGAHASEVAFAIAQSSLLAKNYGDAVTQFAAIEKDPRVREQALFFGATASKELGKIDNAISTLEKLAGGELRTPMSVRGAMLLAQLYSQKGQSDKAIQTIDKIHSQIAMVDNIVDLNATTVELGDQFFAKKLYADALECYRAAYPREQILRMQNERIAAMQHRLDENLVAARVDPSQFAQLAAENNQLKTDIARTQSLLDQFQKLPSITPAIYIRMARCFLRNRSQMGSCRRLSGIGRSISKCARARAGTFRPDRIADRRQSTRESAGTVRRLSARIQEWPECGGGGLHAGRGCTGGERSPGRREIFQSNARDPAEEHLPRANALLVRQCQVHGEQTRRGDC